LSRTRSGALAAIITGPHSLFSCEFVAKTQYSITDHPAWKSFPGLYEITDRCAMSAGEAVDDIELPVLTEFLEKSTVYSGAWIFHEGNENPPLREREYKNFIQASQRASRYFIYRYSHPTGRSRDPTSFIPESKSSLIMEWECCKNKYFSNEEVRVATAERRR
jgi:hypothetical protein